MRKLARGSRLGSHRRTILFRIEPHAARARVAYLTMEIGLRPEMHTYSGGLGVLAGDVARSAADLGLPMVFVTLLSRGGYVRQEIDAAGAQVDHPDPWDPAPWAAPLDARAEVTIEGRAVQLRAWLHEIEGVDGARVPVLLLDTDLPGNAPEDRRITDRLYGGDDRLRLRQEAVLGLGGERLLRALGFSIRVFHLNEGHAALLPLALLLRQREADPTAPLDPAPVRAACVFTTHTPVAAGHDLFEPEDVASILGDLVPQEDLARLAGDEGLDMTRLALSLSGWVNAVSERHAETARRLYPGQEVHAITNGVHARTWVHPAKARLFDGLVPDWRREPALLLRADRLDDDELLAAHAVAKAGLVAEVRARGGPALDPALPILGFARRMTGYKRADLLFQDADRLAAIAARQPFQVVMAGKAHPNDTAGKALIRAVHAQARALAGRVRVAFVPGYDMALAAQLVAGADVWLNTPLPPLEASGTSGMKAALNGLPNLSVLDGWWVEGCEEGVTGWAVEGPAGSGPDGHAKALLDKLEGAVLPLLHGGRAARARVMKGSIARAAPLFDSHRMMRRYASAAYLR